MMKFASIVDKIWTFFVELAFTIWNQFFQSHTPTPPIVDDVLVLSATQLAADIRSRQRTSVSVVGSFVQRIQKINPILNCFVADRFHAALAEAADVDALLDTDPKSEKISLEKKPFLGVPFTCKDFFAVKGLPNTCGLYALKGRLATEDAAAVSRMREAGAISLGLTNVPELCWWGETSNTIHGITRNPYDNRRMVGGSSGGEGCLISAGGSLWGLGTDIGGSIRTPAFFNGIFGHKPTRFMVPNRGQYPYDPREDVYNNTGPMCRYAGDLMPMLKVIAGKENSDTLKLDEPVDLKKINLKVYSCDVSAYVVDEELQTAQRLVADFLKGAFNADVETTNLLDFSDTLSLWTSARTATGSPPIHQLMGLPGENPVNPWKELLLKFFGMSEHTLPAIFLALMASRDPNPTAHYERRKEYLKATETELDRLLGTNGILLCPPHPFTTCYHHQMLFRTGGAFFVMMFNLLGLPVTQVPLGLGQEGAPIGLQIIAGHHQDRLCLAVAKELEKKFGGWVRP